MSISPISFRGEITLKTYINDNPKDAKVETIKTTKQQDGMLLKSAAETLRKIGYKEHVYPKDTQSFHETLEKVVGRPIQQNQACNKFFCIGGKTGNVNEYQAYLTKYNTSYNKLFYNENSFSRPITSVTIDFMEPEERHSAAMEKLSSIQNKVKTIFNCKTNDPNFSNYSYNVKPEKYALMEEILATTEKILDGYFEGPDFLIHTHTFQNSEEAYNALMKNLMKAAGMNYKAPAQQVIDNKELGTKDMNNIRRAVHYLELITPKLYE